MKHGQRRAHTLEEVKNVIRKLDKVTGKKYSRLPMLVDKRMTRSLAYAVTRFDSKNGKILIAKAVSFKFSYHFLNADLTDEQFEGTILHEYLHLYTNELYLDNCQHDYRFKRTCREFGHPELGSAVCDREIGRAFDFAILCYKAKKSYAKEV